MFIRSFNYLIDRTIYLCLSSYRELCAIDVVTPITTIDCPPYFILSPLLLSPSLAKSPMVTKAYTESILCCCSAIWYPCSARAQTQHRCQSSILCTSCPHTYSRPAPSTPLRASCSARQPNRELDCKLVAFTFKSNASTCRVFSRAVDS